MNLYEIGDELIAFEELLVELGGEIPEGPEGEELAKQWENLLVLEERKIDNYCGLIKNLQARSEARAAEAKRLAALASAEEKSAKRLTERLQQFFEFYGKDKFDTVHWKLRIQGNGGKAPLIVEQSAMEKPEELPEQFRRVTFEVNNTALREALEKDPESEEYKAAAAIAKIGERGKSLRIR